MKPNFIKLSLVTAIGLFADPLYAQQAISGAYLDTIISNESQSLEYIKYAANDAASVLPGLTNINYKFGIHSGYDDNKKEIKSFTAGGFGYTYTNDVVVEVRVQRNQADSSAIADYQSEFPGTTYDSPNVLRDMAYYEGFFDHSTNTVHAKSSYTPLLSDLFISKDVSIGIDNLFANTRATNLTNIERIDVISDTGLPNEVSSANGFAIFERGDYDAHDPCVLGIITSLDSDGNPASYATKFIRIQESNYNTSISTNRVYQQPSDGPGFIILRRDNQDDSLQVSDIISNSQGIGGVVLTFADFDIPAGDVVYGYSVFANDFYTANGNTTEGMAEHAVDYTNTAYFPLNTSDSTGAGGIDLSTVAGIVKILNIKGKVFHDYNGLSDSLVGGTSISSPDGSPLFVNLVDGLGKVVGSTAVTSDGSYELQRVGFGDLTLELSTSEGIVDEDAPLSNLPVNWGFAGEHFGNNNFAGSGNDYSGAADGQISIRLQDLSIDNANFGIQQFPDTDTLTATLGTLTYGAVLQLISASSLPELSGSDPEEGILGADDSYAITDLTGMEGNILNYEGTPVIEGQVIKGYTPSLLSVTLNGTESMGFTFHYSSIDAAGLVDTTPGVYSVEWSTPLPVSLLDFTATEENNTVRLKWITVSEKDNSGFYVERSSDSKVWNAIGFVKGAGTSNDKLTYSYLDSKPFDGANYYRLKQVDLGGSYIFSKVVKANFMSKLPEVKLYPNPAEGNVTVITLEQPLSIDIVNASGQKVDVAVEYQKERSTFSVSNLPSGIYFVIVKTSIGSKTIEIVVK